jgi:hypothetical protein
MPLDQWLRSVDNGALESNTAHQLTAQQICEEILVNHQHWIWTCVKFEDDQESQILVISSY